MSLLKPNRTLQYPLLAEFVINPAVDTMVNTSGATDNFSAVGSHVFDIVGLPPGAIIHEGEIVTETAITGSTAFNVTLGDSANASRYFATTDCTSAARRTITPTGYVGAGENIRLTVAPTVGAVTAGKISIRFEYSIRGRANEVQIS